MFWHYGLMMIYWAFSCLSGSLRSPELSSLLVLYSCLPEILGPGKAPGQDVRLQVGPGAVIIGVVNSWGNRNKWNIMKIFRKYKSFKKAPEVAQVFFR